MKKNNFILFHTKAILTATAFAVVTIPLTACNDAHTAVPISTETVQIPNPFTDCSSLEEAASITGFDFTVPDNILDFNQSDIQTMNDEMIQIFYFSDTATDDEILLRKSSATGDISGDYTDYSSTETVQMDDISVTLKGSETLSNTALWEKDGYSYSIYSSKGLDRSTIEDLIQTIH